MIFLSQRMKTSRLARFCWLLIFISCLLLIGAFRRKDCTGSVRQPTPEKYRQSSTHQELETSVTEPSAISSNQIPEDDSFISKIRAALQDNESRRVLFCNEHEDDTHIHYVFIVEKPTTDDQRKITDLVKSAKGATTDWFSENIISWQHKLLDEYSLPNEYDYFSISIDWPKNSNDGRYSILGITKSNLAYDNYNNPYSTDGKANIIQLGTMFDAEKPWRFSHILDNSRGPEVLK